MYVYINNYLFMVYKYVLYYVLQRNINEFTRLHIQMIFKYLCIRIKNGSVSK